ncbi:hypothetical protein KQI41_14225 [Tissierella pigra]|uniref:Uncharacterized protein n=1 Tax=Tissierella pigra TaxID=2607614 RepID=A0A6N7XWV6_9FIRM|nr:hypothetical protein [Tissierella pigra]MBU5427541.1 hypothetical protein [Tissierella pigra]MSU00290.1 hypothetical protein [Tissierella pigra]
MDFDYLSFLSFMMFFVCFISIGYIALRAFKVQLPYTTISCYGIGRSKFLDYNIYLDITDYRTYEKYQIWRFYFPD